MAVRQIWLDWAGVHDAGEAVAPASVTSDVRGYSTPENLATKHPSEAAVPPAHGQEGTDTELLSADL